MVLWCSTVHVILILNFILKFILWLKICERLKLFELSFKMLYGPLLSLVVLTTKYNENFFFNDSFNVYSFMQPENAFRGKNKINWSFVKNIILTFKFWFLLGNWFSSLSNMHLTLSGKVLHFVVQFVNISRVSCLTLKGEISFPWSTHKHRVRENASSI